MVDKVYCPICGKEAKVRCIETSIPQIIDPNDFHYDFTMIGSGKFTERTKVSGTVVCMDPNCSWETNFKYTEERVGTISRKRIGSNVEIAYDK
jgi:hypothetical protein